MLCIKYRNQNTKRQLIMYIHALHYEYPSEMSYECSFIAYYHSWFYLRTSGITIASTISVGGSSCCGNWLHSIEIDAAQASMQPFPSVIVE